MIPATLGQLLQLCSILRLDHSILLETQHRGTDQVALPDRLEKKRQIVTSFVVTVGLGLDTHDLPKDNAVGKDVAFGIIRPSMGNFGCHCELRRHGSGVSTTRYKAQSQEASSRRTYCI